MAISRRSAHMNVMVEAAEKAGRALLRDFGEVENLQVSKKGPGDFVSAADHKAEKIVRTVLQKARPTYDLLMEESGETKGSDRSLRWIVDPLDGTTNFLHGIPHWAVSIALEKDKQVIAGVVYDPVKDEIFTAEKGMGAFVNNRRLRVSNRGTLADALVAIGREKAPGFLDEIEALAPLCSGIRRFGAAALDLAYVAAGRFDIYWERNLHPWDAAAGSLMVLEAGGRVTDLDGGKDYVYGKSLAAASIPLHGELMKKLKRKTVS